MTLTACRCAPVRPSAVVNDAIRALVERTAVWTPGALAVLAELRAEWREAVDREAAPAA